MKKKLTLTLDPSVIERAKAYAKNQEVSVSNLVENYLKAITALNDVDAESSKVEEENVQYKTENTPLVKKMRGIMGEHELTGNERLEYLLEKYG